MDLHTHTNFRAALFASLVAAPAFWFGRYVSEPQVILREEWWVVFVGPVYLQIYAYPVSLVGLLLIGLPCHALLRAVKIDSYILVGALGAPITFLLCKLIVRDIEYSHILFQFLCCGAAVSALYAYLSKKFNKSNQAGTLQSNATV